MGHTPVVVIGHKNPDTDSVCAAIAYAEYKTCVDGQEARAYRAGNTNAQTRFALESFRVDAPPLLTDVYPRIRDIMIPRASLFVMRPTDPIAAARRLILDNRFTFLPVADEDDRSLGKVTALRLAALMDELDLSRCTGRVELDTATLVSGGSPATLIHPDDAPFPDRISGTIVPLHSLAPGGPPPSRTFPDRALLIGSVRDVLAIDGTGARERAGLAVVATGDDQSAVERLREWAGGSRIPTVAAAGDLATLCATVRLSMPIASCLEDAGPTFRPDDLLKDVNREVNRYNEGGFIIVDDERRIVGVVTRINFMTDARFRAILVDHNELSQSVDGMEGADVIEIIDHHRIGGRSTSEPITFVNRAVGSTCTIITNLYRQAGAMPSASTAGLLLSGLLSDTVVLRSPTSTPADSAAAAWLAEVAGVDAEEYGERMFEAGSELQQLTPREILERDLKYYEEEDFQFSVSQVEMVGFKSFWDRSTALTSEVAAHCARAGLGFACLMVTDITHGVTLLVVAGDDRMKRRISHPEVGPGVYEMKDVLSRKKQVLPYLSELLQQV